MKTWKIYKHTLLIGSHAGWSYIGQTSSKNPNTRWHGGSSYKQCVLFWAALQKYGWDNFSHEIIEENIKSLKAANKREKYWIAYYHTWIDDPECKGYNLTSGGNSHETAEVTRQRLIKSHLGQVITEETKLKISQALKGQKRPKEVCEKISAALKGKKKSAESIAKMKANLPDKHGKNHPLYGKHHSDKTKQKIREAKLGKPGKNKGKKMPKSSYEFKQIKVICIELNIIFESLSAAAKYLNSSPGLISAVCQHKPGHKTIKGYHLEYYKSQE